MRKGDSPLISSMSAMSLNIAAIARFCISPDLAGASARATLPSAQVEELKSWRVGETKHSNSSTFQLFNSLLEAHLLSPKWVNAVREDPRQRLGAPLLHRRGQRGKRGFPALSSTRLPVRRGQRKPRR